LKYVIFKLEELATVVDTSIKHDRVRRDFEVAAAHWGGGGNLFNLDY
jgi:hypothetical protein